MTPKDDKKDPAAKGKSDDDAAAGSAPVPKPLKKGTLDAIKKTKVTQEWKHTSPLVSCRISPDGRFVFGGSENNSVLRFELGTDNQVALAGHDSWVRCLEFSNDGTKLISGGYDGRLIWWDATTAQPKPERTLDAHDGWIRFISKNAAGTLLATGGNDNLVKIWDLASGEKVAQWSGHEKNIYSTLFTPDDQYVLSGDLSGVIKQWEISTGKEIRTFDAKALHSYNGGQRVDFGGVRCMAMDSDSQYLACAGLHKASNPLGAIHEPIVLLLDWKTGKLIRSHVAPGIQGVMWRILFHPDGYLIGGDGGKSGGYILYWQLDQEKDIHRIKLPHVLRDLDLHPDHLQVATAHYDKQMRISSR